MDAHPNFAYSTVATAPSPATSGTTLVVGSGEGARFGSTFPFQVTIYPANASAATIATQSETATCTGRSTDTLTLTRNTEGPNGARTVVIGDQIAATITAKSLTDIETLYAKLVSPALTGSPTAPTQTAKDNSTKLATTAYVDQAQDGWTLDTNTFTLPATTVAVGSNTVATSSAAFVATPGTGTVNVASTTGFPTTGVILVIHAGVTSHVFYTGVTSTSFTGCHIGGIGVTMATNDVVRLNGFAVASTDVSARYKSGTKIKWSESATVKYGATVSQTTFSTNTYIVLAITSDYVVAAAPDASSVSYSYADTPQGWPGWFNWPSFPTGYSANPTGVVYTWQVTSRGMHINFGEQTNGTSNATTHTYSLPGLCTAAANGGSLSPATCVDNGAVVTGYFSIGAGLPYANVAGIASTGLNTAANGSRFFTQSTYQTA